MANTCGSSGSAASAVVEVDADVDIADISSLVEDDDNVNNG